MKKLKLGGITELVANWKFCREGVFGISKLRETWREREISDEEILGEIRWFALSSRKRNATVLI